MWSYFLTFRTDRGRQLTEVLTQVDMPELNMHKLKLHFVTMTNYDDAYNDIEVVYKKDNLRANLRRSA